MPSKTQATEHVVPPPAVPTQTPIRNFGIPGGGLSIPASARELAPKIDGSRTYVFLVVTSRADLIRLNLVSVQVFARRDGRWRTEILYLRPGETIRGPAYPGKTFKISQALTPGEPTTLNVESLRPSGDDLLLTLIDADGTKQTRSAKADFNSPVRQFLAQMTSFSGQAWEQELFGP